MNISLRFRLPQGQLPSDSEQLTDLWKAAKLLEPLGFPLGEWYPPADTPEHSMLNPAFDDDGPSPAAPAVFRAGEQQDEFPGLRSFGVWNGKEGPGALLWSRHCPCCQEIRCVRLNCNRKAFPR